MVAAASPIGVEVLGGYAMLVEIDSGWRIFRNAPSRRYMICGD
jgi:hypothetical protein